MYLEYKKSNGYVVKIHEQMPTNVQSGNDIVLNNSFNIGDEFKYYIEVGLEPVYQRDENGDLVLVDGNPVIIDKVPNGVVSAIQQAPAIEDIKAEIAQRLDAFEARIADLESKIV